MAKILPNPLQLVRRLAGLSFKAPRQLLQPVASQRPYSRRWLPMLSQARYSERQPSPHCFFLVPVVAIAACQAASDDDDDHREYTSPRRPSASSILHELVTTEDAELLRNAARSLKHGEVDQVSLGSLERSHHQVIEQDNDGLLPARLSNPTSWRCAQAHRCPALSGQAYTCT
jgi:hypothetical protein